MTDPLKLPLQARLSWIHEEEWVVVDDDGCALEMTKHRVDVIIAALTADASGVDEHIDWDAMDIRKVWRQMNRYAVYLETQGNLVKELERQLAKMTADAEKEVEGDQ